MTKEIVPSRVILSRADGLDRELILAINALAMQENRPRREMAVTLLREAVVNRGQLLPSEGDTAHFTLILTQERAKRMAEFLRQETAKKGGA